MAARRARSSPLGRIFDDQDRRRPIPHHGDLASAADDPVRAPAATAAPSAIACSPRPRDRMGPHRRARLAQRRRRNCLRAGHGTNVERATPRSFMSYLGGRKARYATASLPRPSADGRRSPSLAQASQRYLLKHMMIDALEKRLVEALKSVDAHGDVAPAHVHDPMTMLLRENAVRANLTRWDDGRGRYVLTGTGRRRIVEGSRAPGAVVSFRNRGVVGSGALHRKSADTNLKE